MILTKDKASDWLQRTPDFGAPVCAGWKKGEWMDIYVGYGDAKLDGFVWRIGYWRHFLGRRKLFEGKKDTVSILAVGVHQMYC
jgi:hypothetical protein